MRSEHSAGDAALSPTQLLEIERARDRFEVLWRDGQRPTIEDCLSDRTEPMRSALLRALLAMELERRQSAGERPVVTEYEARFPGDGALVAAAFASAGRSPKGPVAVPDQRASDTGRNLLFGLLALQNSFIDRDSLVAAFSTWVADKSNSLGAILLGWGVLDSSRHALLDALVAEHLKFHGGDPERSLAALAVGPSTRESLQRVGDRALDASLSHAGLTTATVGQDTVFPHGLEMSSAPGQRFRVLRPHAQGGLGAVFVAVDNELNREVALKEILDRHADNPVNRARFLMEAEITARLEHPGIVPVYGLGTYADGRPFYAMRFIRGDSLKEAIERFHGEPGRVCAESPIHGEPGRVSAGNRSKGPQRTRSGKTRGADASPLAFRQLLRRFLDVCNAIDYAHSRGVLHRDVKPGNVIVGRYGETLVVDWGLAKPIGQRDPRSPGDERTLWPMSASGSAAETLPGSALGTPAYMSPEQAAGEIDRLGPRSDVYSLGATLYALLTGRPPFGGAQADEILRLVTKGLFPPPRRIDPTIDRALEAVCLKAMALKPEDRYATPRALADDVERWIADEPVTALPESMGSRLARWSRRNRPWVRAGAAALVVVLITTGAFAVQQARSAARERRARDREHEAAARERQSSALAQRRLGQIEKANDLLADIFDDIDPRAGKPGQSLSEILGERLERAATQLDTTDIGDPLTAAKLQIALGKSLLHLGYPAKAVAMFEHAKKVRADRLGSENADTLDSKSHLADAYAEVGRFGEALALVEETVKLQTASLGVTHLDTLQSRDLLAQLYGRLGRFAQAIALQEENVKLQTAAQGPEHPHTLTSRNNLAILYDRAGRETEAIKIHEETLKGRTARLGPDHSDTLNSRYNLATAYSGAGRLSEAIKMHEETLALRSANSGASHPQTLNSRNNLALAYYQAGRWAEALALQEETVKLQTAKLGADHPNTLLGRSNLSSYLAAGGRLIEAIALLQEMVKAEKLKLGPDDPETLRSQGNLANLYAKAGRSAEALALHKEVLKLRESKFGPDHPDMLASRGKLAAFYESLGRWSDAELLRRDNVASRRKSEKPSSLILATEIAGLAANLSEQWNWTQAETILRECLAIRETAIPDDWPTFNTMSQLGGALLGQGKLADAEPLILHGYEGMKAREKTIPPIARQRMPEAAARIVRLYEDWGKVEKLANWKTRLGLCDLPIDVFSRP
jgi:serine/threonine protein kinase